MKILVTGATGRVGGHVVRELRARGVAVRALSRDPASADLPTDIQVVAGDLSRPETLDAALDGVDGVHLINFDAASGAVLPQPGALSDRLAAAGVRRITSFRGEAPGALEETLRSGAFDWTDLFVPVEFMANTLRWAEEIRSAGKIRGFGPVCSAMIDESDIGAVAAKMLTTQSDGSRTYTLTGPEALTPADKVRILAEELCVPLAYEAMSADEAIAQWQALGYPDAVVAFLLDWHGDTPANARSVLPTVEEILGRPPRSFRQWVRTHRARLLLPADQSLPGIMRFSIDGPHRWMSWSDTELADVVNEDEDLWAQLGAVGFSRARAGASTRFEFAYDEVLVVTKGRCSVESAAGTQTAAVGEVIYIRAGVPGTFRAEEDVDIVYVASAPYGEVNRAIKATLLEHPAA